MGTSASGSCTGVSLSALGPLTFLLSGPRASSQVAPTPAGVSLSATGTGKLRRQEQQETC